MANSGWCRNLGSCVSSRRNCAWLEILTFVLWQSRLQATLEQTFLHLLEQRE